jgi:hypothetical protein
MAASAWKCSVENGTIVAQNSRTGNIYAREITTETLRVAFDDSKIHEVVFFKMPGAADAIAALAKRDKYNISETVNIAVVSIAFRFDISEPVRISECATINLMLRRESNDEPSTSEAAKSKQMFPVETLDLECKMRTCIAIQYVEHIWGAIPPELYDFALYVMHAEACGSPITFAAITRTRIWLTRDVCIRLRCANLGWMRAVVCQVCMGTYAPGDRSVDQHNDAYRASKTQCTRLLIGPGLCASMKSKHANQVQLRVYDAREAQCSCFARPRRLTQYRFARPVGATGYMSIDSRGPNRFTVMVGEVAARLVSRVSLCERSRREQLDEDAQRALIDPFAWDKEERDSVLREQYEAARASINPHLGALGERLR